MCVYIEIIYVFNAIIKLIPYNKYLIKIYSVINMNIINDTLILSARTENVIYSRGNWVGNCCSKI